MTKLNAEILGNMCVAFSAIGLFQDQIWGLVLAALPYTVAMAITWRAAK